MRKFFFSAFVIVSFVFYALNLRSKSLETTSAVIIPNSPVSTPTTESGVQIPMMNSAQMMNGRFKNGVYTGSVADAYYGNIQVKATVSGGKIIDVQFLDYPHDRRTSEMINQQAMPDLKTEAITAQSANVDIVSGATATSQAFQQSLQSALSQAQ